MEKILFIVITLVIALTSCSKKQSQKAKSNSETNDPIFIEVGEEKVTVSEFKYFYEKNNRNSNDYSEGSVKDYLLLFKNFKLKVAEANKQGLQHEESFKNEFEGYRKELAKPYLTEDNFNEKLAKEAFERSKTDVRTSHILIKVAKDAKPADTLMAFNKLKEIVLKINNGSDFGDLAKQYSEDKSAQMEGAPRGYKGDLGYFSALSLVYEYENRMFSTPVGEISPIFRTQFGYHILKVTDKKESEGEIKVAQILVRSAEGSDSTNKAFKKKKIDDIYEELVKGENWKVLCEQYSEDEKSKLRGGEMQPFSKGGFIGVPEFERAAFALKEVGDYSKPIKTPFGWHIIKLLNNTKNANFEDVKDLFVKKVRSKPRAQLDKVILTTRLQSQNNFNEIATSKALAINAIDTTYLTGSWEYSTSNKLYENKLFSLNDDNYLIKDFLAFAKSNQKKNSRAKSYEYVANQTYDKFVQQTVYNYEESHLEEKHFSYKMLVKEYRDGILLFDLMKRDVWDKAQKDTTALKEYYASNLADYKWKERINAVIYTLKDKENQEELITLIDDTISIDSIKTIFDKKSPIALRVKQGKYEQNGSSIIRKIDWSKSRNIIETKDGVVIVETLNKIAPVQKEFNEAKGLIISDYQTVMEKEWLKTLEKQHTIKVNEEELNKLIK